MSGGPLSVPDPFSPWQLAQFRANAASPDCANEERLGTMTSTFASLEDGTNCLYTNPVIPIAKTDKTNSFGKLYFALFLIILTFNLRVNSLFGFDNLE